MAESRVYESAASPGFAYTLKRSAKRRSLCIEVKQAQVILRAPMGVAESVAVGFLRQKAAWVMRKIQEQSSQLAVQPREREYASGSTLPYLGQSLRLVIGYGTRSAVARVDDALHLLLSNRSRQPLPVQIRQALERWYQQQALALLTRKTLALCERMGLVCNQVNIRATRSKWGHCTSRGVIQYNWHILLAPEAVVDYLVAHEVCHLRHHNHSPAFWALVASVCPEYATLRHWLKQEGAGLHL
ncbi:M48 family metallopeptidase [Cellvibrio japonicus]|uniref:YgjP-like metallopeptidase domain-containing protein n=1 Tax=Cellvibrio japonicus (strain Ueda107) TaxID=498211 RepID=B3PDT3_CELJU|nr:SprT family zinc-dependent metalloprotease [Cellvibrio japonicus]ACE85848.1 conserved hypothetical protein [Cellvibrio japonicus Ueda107]